MGDSHRFALDGQVRSHAFESGETKTSSIGSALKGALHFARLGFRVFPIFQMNEDGICSCGQACASPGKHPRFSGWKDDATCRAKTIQNWARKYPGTNFAAIPGPEHVVIDLDQHGQDSGFETMALLQQSYGPLGPTLSVKTPKGLHLYFKAPQPIGNGASKAGPGIDHRGVGGYVLLPGSNHHTGLCYELAEEAPPALLPAWLLERLVEPPKAPEAPKKTLSWQPQDRAEARRARAYVEAALEDEALKVTSAPVGARNNTLNEAAFKLFGLALGSDLLSVAEVRDRLMDAALQVGLERSEIKKTLKSARKAARSREVPPPAEKRVSPAPSPTPKSRLTLKTSRPMAKDGTEKRPIQYQVKEEETSGPSKVLIVQDKSQLSYAEIIVKELLDQTHALRYWAGHFYLLKDERYERLNMDDVHLLVTESLAKLHQIDRNTGELRRISVTAQTVRGTTFLIKSHRRIYVPAKYPIARWTGKKWVRVKDAVSAKNGILDLESGTFEAHGPDLFCPRASEFRYEKGAMLAPRWEAFLDRIFTGEDGSSTPAEVEEAKEALQRYMGYCLCPDYFNLQKGLFLHGPTRSGKGTILQVLRKLVGNASASELRMSELGSRFGLSELPSSTVVMLPDLRLDQHSRKQGAVSTLLSITSGDPQQIEQKGKDPFTVCVKVGLLACSNELPNFPDSSNALLHRFVFLKFKNCYLGREDESLFEKLMAEGPAILGWALEGLRKLKEKGMLDPEQSQAVKRQERSLGLGQFTKEHFELDENSEVQRDELVRRYRAWCEQNGERAMPLSALVPKLRAAVESMGANMEIIYDRKGDQRSRVPRYRGLKLRT